MPKLTDLPGVSDKEVECGFFQTISGCQTVLRQFKAATAAGDKGAINVWVDDDGRYRVAFCRRLIVVNTRNFATLAEVRVWLKKFMPCLWN